MVTKLKLGAIADDKPIRVTHDLPPAVHRDLVAYTEVLARETGAAVEPVKLIAPMLERFMSTDREVAKQRRAGPTIPKRSAPSSEPASSGESAKGSEIS